MEMTDPTVDPAELLAAVREARAGDEEGAASASAEPLRLTRGAADSVPVEAVGLDAWEAHAVPRQDGEFDQDAWVALHPLWRDYAWDDGATLDPRTGGLHTLSGDRSFFPATFRGTFGSR